MILSEQGANFFSEEVGGAEGEETGERPRKRLREGNLADGETEIHAIHARGTWEFGDDADFVVTRGEGGNARLPTTVRELLEFGIRSFQSDPNWRKGFCREVVRNPKGVIGRVFVEETFSLRKLALDDEFDAFEVFVAPGKDGCGAAAGWKKSCPMKFRLKAARDFPRQALAERFSLGGGEDSRRLGGWRGKDSGSREIIFFRFRIDARRLDIDFPWGGLQGRKPIGLCDQQGAGGAGRFPKLPIGPHNDVLPRGNIESILLSMREREAIPSGPDKRSGCAAAGVVEFCAHLISATGRSVAELALAIELPLET